MKTILLLALLVLVALVQAQHNYEFYIKGAHVTVTAGTTGNEVGLHVQGDIHLDEGTSTEKGTFNNDGIVELRGDFYIRNDNVEQTDGVAASLPGTSTGIVRFKNRGFGSDGLGAIGETTHQSENQRINISGATDATGLRAFYNVELENDNNTDAAVTDNFVDIDGGDVEVKNELTFNNDSRIRTDKDISGGTPPTGADYLYELILSNSSAGAIVNASTTAGDNKRYIEGKLARQVNGTGSYYFPVGLHPGFSGADGMAAFQINTTSAVNQQINSYLSDAQTELGVPQIYCDIGELVAAQPWNTCHATNGPDGNSDFAFLDKSQSHEWLIESSGGTISYDLEVFPGAGQNATVSSIGHTCGGVPFHIRFLAKDGVLIDGGSTGTVIDPPHPFNLTQNFPIGYDLCPPTSEQAGNVINALTSFSRFRLHGTSDFGANTVLPVELIVLQANAIDDSYIEVYWATGSEVNNAGFELQRSLDGITFEPIAWIDGNGTTSNAHDYLFNDISVEHNVIYYYRLK